MQSLTLLNACVKNCGRTFHLEIASREFINECRSLISDKTHPRVAQKLKLLIKSWAENEFKSDSSLSLIPSLYNSLKAEGHSFVSDEPQKSKIVLSKDPNVVSSQEEEEDVAKAIALSLQEAEKKSKSGGGGGGSSLYPSVSNPSSTQLTKTREPRKVRALYDFEAVEDNELTFKAGEIIGVTDDSDVNWWKGVSWRGEGLFPANFVTSDLTTESTTEPEVVEVQNIEPEQIIPRIDEEKIDNALVMIQNADPTGEVGSDPPELSALEDQCRSMAPLIDQELEKIDRQHGRLTELNGRLVEALQLYHSLMQELPTYAPQPAAANQPNYVSLQMYSNQQPLTLGQIPSGITAEVGPVPPTQMAPSYFNPPQQYSLTSSYPAAVTYNTATVSMGPYPGSVAGLPPGGTIQQQQPIYSSSGNVQQQQHHMM
jgi:signal transducing adaptor molecule